MQKKKIPNARFNKLIRLFKKSGEHAGKNTRTFEFCSLIDADDCSTYIFGSSWQEHLLVVYHWHTETTTFVEGNWHVLETELNRLGI